MKPLFTWRHQYDQERDKKEGDLAALRCEDESLTQQSFTQDADINVIAKRFGLTEIPLSQLDPTHFRDTTHDPDLNQVLTYRNEARERFAALPEKIKRRFHYNPSELWNFVNDPENSEEALRLHILARTPEAAATPAPTAQHATSSSATDQTASAPSAATGTQTVPPQGTPQTSQKGT